MNQILCGLQDPARRQEGERVLLAFRRSANVLPVCQYILDNTTSPAVQFQVAIALREVSVRDYSLLSADEVEALKGYLLNFVYSRPTWVLCLCNRIGLQLTFNEHSLENYVRDTLISAITVVIKRGWLDDNEEKRQTILHRITELLNTDLFGVSHEAVPL